ncbi:acyltransferase family protein [Rosenbergiella nectarea]|uniref:acyltransferase family protein n=1 Tax=Rosenbergiella nectarea TaxID=988801 RepID=UPI001BDA21DA|nr:acyltransferase [Rosenbergiella nectarea]MBT0730307.1 acyltransferase [Rosenbergiella nectarea subsp. apis]
MKQLMIENSLFIIILLFPSYLFLNKVSCGINKIEIKKYEYRVLEGLRGICSLLVVFHHYFWRLDPQSKWSIDYLNGSIYKYLIVMMGQIPVCFFFILSGFLFFNQVGRLKSIAIFYIKRLARIYPSILLSLVFSIIISSYINGQLNFEISGFYSLLPFVNTYFEGSSYGAVPIYLINNGIMWTLVWEIRLYISIPILDFFNKYLANKLFLILICVVVTFIIRCCGFISDQSSSFIMLFIIGFLASAIKSYTLTNQPSKIIAITFVCIAFSLFNNGRIYNFYSVFIFLPVFLTMVYEYKIWSFLKFNSFQYLGMISFSLYLYHGCFQYLFSEKITNPYLWLIISTLLLSVLMPFIYKSIEVQLSDKIKYKLLR